MVQEAPPPNNGMSFDENGELPVLQKSFEDMIRLRLRLWFIRWVIGFAIIWVVTAWTGRFEWLWTAGIIVCLASLVLTLGATWFMKLKFAKANAASVRLAAELKAIENERHERDD